MNDNIVAVLGLPGVEHGGDGAAVASGAAAAATPNQVTPAGAKADTSYVLLSLEENGTWRDRFTTTAKSPEDAIRAFVATLDEQSGKFVAVAAKFWKPTTVKAVTVTETTIVLSEAKS